MSGKSHGRFEDPSPHFWVSFAPSTAKPPLTFMPLKSHSALATWSRNEAGNLQAYPLPLRLQFLGGGYPQKFQKKKTSPHVLFSSFFLGGGVIELPFLVFIFNHISGEGVWHFM